MNRVFERSLVAACVACATLLVPSTKLHAQQQPIEQSLTATAEQQLSARAATIHGITSKQQADARKAHVRETMLRLLDGLPENSGPLNAQVIGTIPQEGFHIERVIYDSLPGYHVPANLYIPDGKGPFPVVIYHAGHGPFGKSEAFGMGAALARNDIALLAYDPLGAGERLQAINPATGKSWAGPDEHSQAQIPISLVGDHVARYMMWDAMRGIDYLSTRADIDIKHVGSYGCSGGGTLSAYLTALDPRVQAGAVACYHTTYDALLNSIGPQDGEQVIPNFIHDGLDFADLIEVVAPKPYAMISTTEDMFPFAGAKATHDEAERFYSLYGATDKLQFFTGPGRHGAVRPLMPKILSFFMVALADNHAEPVAVTLKPLPPAQLACTTTGQVTTALQGRTIYAINREREAKLVPAKAPITSKAAQAKAAQALRKDVMQLTGMSQQPGKPATLTVNNTSQRDGYTLQDATFHDRFGIPLPATILLPASKGKHKPLLIVAARPTETLLAPGGEADKAAHDGRVVMVLTPLPWPKSTDGDRPTMGTMLPMTSRAFLVGKTFVGMRTEDTLDALHWIAAQPNVDATSMEAHAYDASGVVLLHAALFEPRLKQITVEHALSTYQSVVDADVHRGVTESVVPGVLRHYDLDDIMLADTAHITLIDPIDGSGASLTEDTFHHQFQRVLDADKALNMPDHVSWQPAR